MKITISHRDIRTIARRLRLLASALTIASEIIYALDAAARQWPIWEYEDSDT